MIDVIKCTDPGVVAALSQISIDDGVNGTRNNFDATVTFLIPTDPIQIKQKSDGDKRPVDEIASVEMKKASEEQAYSYAIMFPLSIFSSKMSRKRN